MKLTTEQRKALVLALRELAAGEIPGECYGICWNLQQQLLVQGRKVTDAYDVVSHFSIKWPGRTGGLDQGMGTTCSYPIAKEYFKNGNRKPYWVGQQREQRMALIDYLIQEIQA